MKKHGGISIALAASRKSAASGSTTNHSFADSHNLNVHVNLGGGDAQTQTVNLPGNGAGKSDVRSLIGKGFCNFFDKPTNDQVFRYDGKLIDHTREIQEPLRKALMKLAYTLEGDKARLGVTSYGDAGKASQQNDENPNIPSGYTYLMQLVAHDLVQSVSSLAVTDDGRVALNNNRAAPLRLEAIYNGGPENSPLLYEADSSGLNAPGSYLRLGPLDTQNTIVCPFRDLARFDLSKATADVRHRVEDPKAGDTAVVGAATAASVGPNVPVRLPDVLVGDVRNDDHAILSQLTVVFHLLHNGLVKWTESVTPKAYADSEPEKVIDRYYFGRMAATLIFRNILRSDLMKRLLHPHIYELYSSKAPPKVFVFKGKIPLEFTHGALRVCHVMPRQHYRFNEREEFDLKQVLMENSASDSTITMPLPEFWAVAWSYFFDIDPDNRQKLNLSMRLRPRYQNQTQAKVIFDDFDDTTKPGLAYRDMLSATLAGLWSASAMMTKLANARSEPELANVFQRAKLSDAAYRTGAIRKWLMETCEGGDLKLDDGELDALSRDPPLPFFLMFEAMSDPDSLGLRLGPLGSVIVAAVIFGILDADPLTPDDKVTLGDQLGYLHDNVFGSKAPKLDFGNLESMPDLIRFVSKLHGLNGAKPRFI
jgi:hypothetical protein